MNYQELLYLIMRFDKPISYHTIENFFFSHLLIGKVLKCDFETNYLIKLLRSFPSDGLK